MGKKRMYGMIKREGILRERGKYIYGGDREKKREMEGDI